MGADFVENFLLGFMITAIPGAVVAEAVRRTLAPQPSVFNFLAGNFIGIFLIIGLTFSGLSLASDMVTAKVFYVISGMVLIYIGVRACIGGSKHIHDVPLKKVQPRSFAAVTGFILAVANPLSIIFWISLIGKFFQETNTGGAIANSFGVIAGALAFFAVLIIVLRHMKTHIKTRQLEYVSRACGLIVVGYGLSMCGKGF